MSLMISARSPKPAGKHAAPKTGPSPTASATNSPSSAGKSKTAKKGTRWKNIDNNGRATRPRGADSIRKIYRHLLRRGYGRSRRRFFKVARSRRDRIIDNNGRATRPRGADSARKIYRHLLRRGYGRSRRREGRQGARRLRKGYWLFVRGYWKEQEADPSTIYDLRSTISLCALFPFDFSMLDVHSAIYTTLKTLIAVAFLIIFLPCFFTAVMVTV